jgi:threonine dehydrogenase-like Zn-dependent dehydrogenase
MPNAIQFIRSVPRWLLVRGMAGTFSSVATGPLSCLAFRKTEPPPLPSPEWVRVRTRLSGVCGSDLSAIACKGSPYFSPFVSTPFVLGHEVVGDVVERGAAVPAQWKDGTRVVIEPALSCEVRGIRPPCPRCVAGHYAHCENILKGSIKAGIQTGYCASTGGGWSDATLVAHSSQLHEVPAALSDDEAVLAEPFACAIHGALKAPRDAASAVLVLGCGSIGLLVIYAYRAAGGQGTVLAAARHPHQAQMAKQLGATACFTGRGSRELFEWTLDAARNTNPTGSIHQPEIGKPVLLGGVDAVLDCVGSSQSMDDAMRLTRPRGTMVLVGMPGIAKGVDWTSAWYKELSIQGAYAYGWEQLNERRVRTMQLALEFLAASNGALKPLVSRRYPLEQYRAALDDAFHAGARGSFKTVFEMKS